MGVYLIEYFSSENAAQFKLSKNVYIYQQTSYHWAEIKIKLSAATGVRMRIYQTHIAF